MHAERRHYMLKSYDLHPTDAPPIHFRGWKLIEVSSKDFTDPPYNSRWYTLTLFCDESQNLHLAIAYDSCHATLTEEETESPRLDVISGGRGRLAIEVARHDFMRPVYIDEYCGGSCALMMGAPHEQLAWVLFFQRTLVQLLTEMQHMPSDIVGSW